MKNRKSLYGWLACVLVAFLGILVLLFAPGYDFSGLLFLGLAVLIACYLGLLHLRRRKPKLAKGALWVLSICLAMGILAAAVTGGIILDASRGEPERDCDYILVLGAGVNGTEPSRSLWDRIQTANAYLRAHPDSIAVVSGGQGWGEDITEAACIFRELTALGIDPARIWLEEQAINTRENLRYSLELIESRTGERPEELGLVSSDYHLYRAGRFAQEQNVRAIGIPAKTGLPHLFLNYFLREIVAVWYYTIFGRL